MVLRRVGMVGRIVEGSRRCAGARAMRAGEAARRRRETRRRLQSGAIRAVVDREVARVGRSRRRRSVVPRLGIVVRRRCVPRGGCRGRVISVSRVVPVPVWVVRRGSVRTIRAHAVRVLRRRHVLGRIALVIEGRFALVFLHARGSRCVCSPPRPTLPAPQVEEETEQARRNDGADRPSNDRAYVGSARRIVSVRVGTRRRCRHALRADVGSCAGNGTVRRRELNPELGGQRDRVDVRTLVGTASIQVDVTK